MTTSTDSTAVATNKSLMDDDDVGYEDCDDDDRSDDEDDEGSSSCGSSSTACEDGDSDRDDYHDDEEQEDGASSSHAHRRAHHNRFLVTVLSAILAALIARAAHQIRTIYRLEDVAAAQGGEEGDSKDDDWDYDGHEGVERSFVPSPATIYTLGSDSPLPEDLTSSYRRDGVVAIRGLIEPSLLQDLDVASAAILKRNEAVSGGKKKKTGTQFHTVESGAIFHGVVDDEEEWGDEIKVSNEVLSSFRRLALDSVVPTVAASLLFGGSGSVERPVETKEDCSSDHITRKTNETLRVVRDIFLTKDDDTYVCGWHVDDLGFWPAIASAPGINAWIALDDMPLTGETQGGFALAIGSHRVPWRHDAYRATGTAHTMPEEGYKNAADMFSNRTGGGTCNLELEAPALHRRMERRKRVYDVRKGDVIFHDRWIFHRTVPVDRSTLSRDIDSSFDGKSDGEGSNSGTDDGQMQNTSSKIYRRYSIRYGPGSSRLPAGYGTEWSVLHDEGNGGRSIDDVVRLHGPWYPKCWPGESDETEMDRLVNLVRDDLPVARERQRERRKEMTPFLREMGRRKHQQRKQRQRPS